MPDAFVVALVLTVLTFVLAVFVGGYGVNESVRSWGGGFWNLLTFTNQITLTLLFGFALANTPPVRKLLAKLAELIRPGATPYLLACFVTGVCALLSWGLSLIVAGIMSRAIGEAGRRRGIRIHYPLLVASAFSGFVIWHQGLSSSIGLAVATPGHFLESQIGLIETSRTLFTTWNASVALIVLLTLPFVMATLRPKDDNDIEEMPDHLLGHDEPDATRGDAVPLVPARRLEESLLLNWLIIAAGIAVLVNHFVVDGGGLTLNVFNFAFLVAGMLLAGTAIRYVGIIVDGGRVAAPFLLQYPFYAGIAGLMADSGLASRVVKLFVSLAGESTLPFLGFLSAGVLNIFIPSGGGQWAVQGPIMMTAAQEIGADLPRVAMSVALGDQWTNLIQPLAILPVIAIAGTDLRKIMGYCFIALLYSGGIFSLALLLS